MESVYLFMERYKSQRNRNNSGYLLSLISFHSKFCCIEKCTSHIILREGIDSLAAGLAIQADTKDEGLGLNLDLFSAHNSDIKIHQSNRVENKTLNNFVHSLIEHLKVRTGISNILIVEAYFQFFNMNNIFLSLHALNMAERMKNNIRNKYFVFHLRKMIEANMELSYTEVKSHTIKYINSLQLIAYQLAYDQTMISITHCTLDLYNYWENIYSPNPSKYIYIIYIYIYL